MTSPAQTTRLPLYEGVDWNLLHPLFLAVEFKSPSLRGSGLKSYLRFPLLFRRFVSLFTREWIEIARKNVLNKLQRVSLFTREWIEMDCCLSDWLSGNCLPLYEGVDWNCESHGCRWLCAGLPLYEGVDWNNGCPDVADFVRKSPSLRGSGLK